MSLKRLLSAAVCLASALAINTACAAYPDGKPIRYIVPIAPGGATDVVGRLVAQQLSKSLGSAVVVENKPGANGSIGAMMVARAPADGLTLLGGTISTFSINQSLYKNLPYDMERDFAPVALIGTLPNVIIVKADSPFHTLQDILNQAKAHPGEVTYGSSGVGSSQHLSGELFQSLTHTKLLHVPYKGSSNIIQALLSSDIMMAFDNLPPNLPLIASGKVRAIAVTSAQRDKHLPNVPTLQELGIKGYDVVSWQAIYAPKATPPEIINTLSTSIMQALKDPEIVKKFDDMAITDSFKGPEGLHAFQQAEQKKWHDVAEKAGIKPE